MGDEQVTRSGFRTRLRELLTTQRLAVLATHGGGQPYGSLVAFAATEDLRHILFATGRATRKFSNLEEDPRAAVVVDNRSQSDTDFHAAAAATGVGIVSEPRPAERQALVDLFLRKHPYLADFVEAPSCALLRLAVDRYLVVTRFQTVMEISPSDDDCDSS